jgi:hypothetical protein
MVAKYIKGTQNMRIFHLNFFYGQPRLQVAEKNVVITTTPRRLPTLSQLQVGIKPYLCNFLTLVTP